MNKKHPMAATWATVIRTLKLIIAATAVTMTALAQGGGNALNLYNANYLEHGDFAYFGAPDYSFGSTLTVSAWVKWTMTPGSYLNMFHESGEGKWANIVTIDKHSSRDNGQFWLQHTTSNNFFEWAVQTSSGRAYITSTTSPAINVWYHLAGVYDAGDPTARMKFYVNGVLEATGNGVSGPIAAHSGNNRLNIGRLPDGYRLFTGMIDELRIWRSALTLEQIREQMHRKETQGSGLASYWPMDASSGTTVADLGPDAVNGVFYTALVDVHSFDAPNKWVTDDDKNWASNEFAGMPVKTVGGAGIDENNTVASNTSIKMYFTSWSTTPILDDFGHNTNGGMTWYGIEDPSETSQWVVSTAPVASTGIGGVLENRHAIRCARKSKPTGDPSSILTVSCSTFSGDECALFGHDNAPLYPTGLAVPTGIHHRIDRVWTTEVRTGVARTGTLVFDLSGLALSAGDESDLRILVDTDGDFSDATFSTGTFNSGAKTLTLSGVTLVDGMHYTIGSISAFNPLPVELENFTVSILGGQPRLRWETRSEKNNHGFMIQRSAQAHGGSWKDIAFIEGHGTSNTPHQYQHIDKSQTEGLIRYRLLQIDRDGTSITSNEVSVNGNPVAAKASMQLSPNPARGAVQISYVLPEPGYASISIVSPLGHTIATLLTSQYCSVGRQWIAFDTSSLPAGTYFLQLRQTQRAIVLPFTVSP